MKRVLVHIGASKCGSSALQTALTQCPALVDRLGRSVSYVSIRRDSLCHVGREVSSEGNVQGYLKSAKAGVLGGTDPSLLARICEGEGTLVLSQEGWFQQPEEFASFARRWPVPLEVLFYVRPQCAWLNSGWWQWGAWTDLPLEVWFARRLRIAEWASWVSRWRDVPNVGSVNVRLMPADIVADFADMLDIADPSQLMANQSNSSLPGPLLRFLQARREFRPHKDASLVDFVLSRDVQISGAVPWVLTPDLVRKAIDHFRPDNERLLTMLSEQDSMRMVADQRWWSVDAFAEKTVETAGPVPPTAEQLEEIAAQLLTALLARDGISLAKLART